MSELAGRTVLVAGAEGWIGSSINAYGGPSNSHDVRPAHYPLDERLPADLDDPYSLSKFTDERTAETAARHWGTDIIALRFR